jgi:hypothetical protein
MKQGWKRRIAIALATAAVGVAVAFLLLREPGFGGHRLTYWVGQLWVADADQEAARRAIRAIGPKGIPHLLAKVRVGDSQRRWMRTWDKLPSFLQELTPAPMVDNRFRQKIPYAISLVGTLAVPHLIAAMHDSDRDVRLTAAQAMAFLGDRADPALPGLIPLITNTNPEFRVHAIFAVSQMGMVRTQAIPALMMSLSDPDNRSTPGAPYVRENAARALGSMGSAASVAVPKLAGLLDDPSDLMRLESAGALWKIQRDTNLVYRVMEQLEKRQGVQVYKGFLDLLAEMGSAARPAVPVILRSMTNWGTDMSRPIRRALAKIDPEAELRMIRPGP